MRTFIFCTPYQTYSGYEITNKTGWACGMNGVGKYIWEYGGKTQRPDATWKTWVFTGE